MNYRYSLPIMLLKPDIHLFFTHKVHGPPRFHTICPHASHIFMNSRHIHRSFDKVLLPDVLQTFSYYLLMYPILYQFHSSVVTSSCHPIPYSNYSSSAINCAHHFNIFILNLKLSLSSFPFNSIVYFPSFLSLC